MPVLRNRRSTSTRPAAVEHLRVAPGAAVIAAVFSATLLSVAAVQAAQPTPSHAPIKWVDASGRVHYSDRQPMPDARGQVVRTQSISARPQAPSIGDPSLPWALRSAAARYPVTLYTAGECDPCDLARQHLAQRGVPYTEKRVDDAAGMQAFHALGFEKPLFPSLSIGPEKLVGFEPTGWDRALDATGYPKSSMLPAKRDPRTVAPLRSQPAQPAAGAGTASPNTDDAAAAAAGNAPAADSGGVESLLSPASFRTGPNPIRF